MGLHLHPRDRVIHRKGLERIHGWMIPSVLQDEGGHCRAGERHLARREALMPMALEPLIGVVDFARPRPAESRTHDGPNGVSPCLRRLKPQVSAVSSAFLASGAGALPHNFEELQGEAPPSAHTSRKGEGP